VHRYQFKQNIHARYLGLIRAIYLCLAIVIFSACGSVASATAATKNTNSTKTPTAAPPQDTAPTPSPTAGPPCTGSLWSSTITFVGPNIPLPPLTVYGLTESFPPANGWVGHYLRLCTSGNLDTVSLFIAQHMPAEGWQYGDPPSDCLCGGLRVWSRPNDNRLIQFDDHPYLLNGTVQWGVSVYTKG